MTAYTLCSIMLQYYEDKRHDRPKEREWHEAIETSKRSLVCVLLTCTLTLTIRKSCRNYGGWHQAGSYGRIMEAGNRHNVTEKQHSPTLLFRERFFFVSLSSFFLLK